MEPIGRAADAVLAFAGLTAVTLTSGVAAYRAAAAGDVGSAAFVGASYTTLLLLFRSLRAYERLPPPAVVVAAGREGLQNLFLDAARVLMLFGAVATVGIGTPSADPMQAFLGLLLWLLGVCLLALVVVPAAGRFRHAALAAVAILKYLFTLWN